MSTLTNSHGSKDKKDETLFDKIGTLGRRKKKEAQDVTEEGRNAIELPASPVESNLDASFYLLEDNEERFMVDPKSRQDPKLKELIKVLIEWINDELVTFRILVKDLEEDLFDGQILQKLIEKLANLRVEVPEVTQSEVGQKQKLKEVLRTINQTMQVTRPQWNVDSIHSKNLASILHLLVEMVRAFNPPIRLPGGVVVTLIIIQKKEGTLQTSKRQIQITHPSEEFGLRRERDAFDTLFDHAPDKLNLVKTSLVNFARKHLMKLNLELTDIDSQFHDGVYFLLLLGLLEGFFIPLHLYHLTPNSFENKVHNVALAFELMEDCNLPTPKARPEDIVNKDSKCTLRVLYNLYTKYKNKPTEQQG